jgi:hypothetical protein
LDQPAVIAPAQKRKSRWLKWALIGCGGLALVGIIVAVVGGYLLYRTAQNAMDPAKVEATAQEILTFEKPEGFSGAFSPTSIVGMKIAILTHSRNGAEFTLAESGVNLDARMLKEAEETMDQRRNLRVKKRLPNEIFHAQGREVVAVVSSVEADSGATFPLRLRRRGDADHEKDNGGRPDGLIRYTMTLRGASGGHAMLMFMGHDGTITHNFVQKFLDTVK